MSQNKAKQKGVEIKDVKDTDRSRTTTERSILTLNPLPKIDPKDKGKKVLEEEAESEGVNEAEKKFKMLANDEEICSKGSEEWNRRGEEELAGEDATIAAFTMSMTLFKQGLNVERFVLRKLQWKRGEKFTIENEPSGYRHAQLNKKKFEEIQVMYEKVKRANENFIPIGSAKDEKLIEKMNEKAVGMDKKRGF
ncbi:hypothetical protein Tco_0155873 [Tanacetum coccineum]